jgi:hypothetical protein
VALSNSKYAESEHPQYLTAQTQYRGLSPRKRSLALTEFLSKIKRPPEISPDPKGIKDLLILIELAKAI